MGWIFLILLVPGLALLIFVAAQFAWRGTKEIKRMDEKEKGDGQGQRS